MNLARLSALAASLLAAGLWATAAQASPCSAPADYVKAGTGERQPLVRPYVVRGLAVTALHRRDGQGWLELAVDSEAGARRALALADGGIASQDGTVLLSCRAIAATAASETPRTQLAQALW